MRPETPIYGLLVEFLTAQEVLVATRNARAAGYRQMDAYTPYPVEGLAAELGLRDPRALRRTDGGLGWCRGGFLHAVLFHGDQLHVQLRRTPVQ